MNLAKIILNNFWAKLISLFLAIATWFYVYDLVRSELLSQKKGSVEEVFSRYDFMARELPVEPVFKGSSPEGYRVVLDKVTVEPGKIMIFGPEEMLKKNIVLRTDPIDLGEYTRSTKLSLGVHSNMKFLRMKDKLVEVSLTVEPLENKEEGAQ